MRNIPCLLPDGHIVVTYWDVHPCDDRLYMAGAWVYGPRGRVGYALEPRS